MQKIIIYKETMITEDKDQKDDDFLKLSAGLLRFKSGNHRQTTCLQLVQEVVDGICKENEKKKLENNINKKEKE